MRLLATSYSIILYSAAEYETVSSWNEQWKLKSENEKKIISSLAGEVENLNAKLSSHKNCPNKDPNQGMHS